MSLLSVEDKDYAPFSPMLLFFNYNYKESKFFSLIKEENDSVPLSQTLLSSNFNFREFNLLS